MCSHKEIVSFDSGQNLWFFAFLTKSLHKKQFKLNKTQARNSKPFSFKTVVRS